jgi:hypothetical protein
MPLGQGGHVAMVGLIPGFWHILSEGNQLHSNQTYSSDIPIHKTTSPLERPFSHYIHLHRLASEMWITMKNNLLGGKKMSCSFSLYRFRKHMSYGFPIINVCNSGVHYESSWMFALRSMLPHLCCRRLKPFLACWRPFDLYQQMFSFMQILFV